MLNFNKSEVPIGVISNSINYRLELNNDVSNEPQSMMVN